MQYPKVGAINRVLDVCPCGINWGGDQVGKTEIVDVKLADVRAILDDSLLCILLCKKSELSRSGDRMSFPDEGWADVVPSFRYSSSNGELVLGEVAEYGKVRL